MTCHSSLPPSVTLTRFDAWAMACCSFRLWNLNFTKPYLSSSNPLKQLSKFTTPQYEISNILLILSSRSYEHKASKYATAKWPPHFCSPITGTRHTVPNFHRHLFSVPTSRLVRRVLSQNANNFHPPMWFYNKRLP